MILRRPTKPWVKASCWPSKTPAQASRDPHPKSRITARNQKESPLLRLPGEIRNKIYSYAQQGGYILIAKKNFDDIDSGKPVKFTVDIVSVPSKGRLYRPIGKTVGPASRIFNLQLVCRQITAETDKLAAYKSNVFSFSNLHESIEFSSQLTTQQSARILNISIDGTIFYHPFHKARANDRPPTVPLRAVFPALQRVYLNYYPRCHVIVSQQNTPSLQRLFMDSGFLHQMDAQNTGLEIVQVDVLNSNADYEQVQKMKL